MRFDKCGGVLIQTADIDDLDLYALQVNGTGDEEGSGSVILKGVNVRGDLTFFKGRPDHYLLHGATDEKRKKELRDSLPDLCDLRASVARDLKATSLTVGGLIDLTNLRAGGEIDLEGTKCDSLKAIACIDKTEADKYDTICGGIKKTTREPRLSARLLNINRLRCTGDADLSGLDIIAEVKASSSRVDGTFAFCGEGNSGDCAKIGKILGLEQVRTPTLRLSGSTFTDDKGKPRREALKLDRAQIVALSLAGPEPYLASLQDLELTQLITPDKKTADQRRRYITGLLRKSWPFDRGIYRTVEGIFRAEGDDTRANEVYRQMRWRGLDPEMEPSLGIVRDKLWRFLRVVAPALAAAALAVAVFIGLSIVLSPILAAVALVALLLFAMFVPPLARLFRSPVTLGQALLIGLGTGFWTKSYRILFLVLGITLPLSWYVFSVPRNIEPTTYRLSESATMQRSDAPSGAEWTLVERWRLIAATHIPVIPFIDGARWEPAENRSLCLPDDMPFTPPASLRAESSDCPKGTWAMVGGFSPAAYGLIVRALHWIAWPLFLIGLSGVIQRTGRQ